MTLTHRSRTRDLTIAAAVLCGLGTASIAEAATHPVPEPSAASGMSDRTGQMHLAVGPVTGPFNRAANPTLRDTFNKNAGKPIQPRSGDKPYPQPKPPSFGSGTRWPSSGNVNKNHQKNPVKPKLQPRRDFGKAAAKRPRKPFNKAGQRPVRIPFNAVGGARK